MQVSSKFFDKDINRMENRVVGRENSSGFGDLKEDRKEGPLKEVFSESKAKDKAENFQGVEQEERKIFASLNQVCVNFLGLSLLTMALMLVGNFIMAFALVNIHIPSKITEGGVIGLSILINKLFGIELPLISFICDSSLYFLGFLLLTKGFLRKSLFSSISFALIYKAILKMGPILPSFEKYPALAAVLGGLFLGFGCGLVVSRGAASGGDDCLALIIQKYTPLTISKAYFISDFTVLILSMIFYLPLVNVLWSLLTTLISSYIIGQIEIKLPRLLADKFNMRNPNSQVSNSVA